MLRATTTRTVSTSQPSKVVRTWCALHDLTSKCASRIFAPQRRARFEHLDFQKCSEAEVFSTCWDRNALGASWRRSLRSPLEHHKFQKCSEAYVLCTCWLRNVLRATAGRSFSSLIWPHGSAPAALASLIFNPLAKTKCFVSFLLFSAPVPSFFWPLLFSDLLPQSSLIRSTSAVSSVDIEVWLLNFLQWYTLVIHIISYTSFCMYFAAWKWLQNVADGSTSVLS